MFNLIVESNKQRNILYNYIKGYLLQAEHNQHDMALLFIKIRDLRQLEINIGHDALELISKKIQARLFSTIEKIELILHTALDTFVVIVPKSLNQGHAEIIANKILLKIQAPIKTAQQAIKLTPVIGISSSENCQSNEKKLYLNALIAFENANANNLACTYFQSEFEHEMNRVWNVKKDIDQAIVDNQFELYFQPKISLNNMEVSGAEALIRWNHPIYGIVSPNSFIPIAENSNQIDAITEWVIKSALRKLSSILKIMPYFSLSINISANNLDSNDLLMILKDNLAIWGVAAKNLIIEVTETTIMRDAKSSLSQLQKIRDIGVGVSIDDFGTGYSSLAYFKNIPATELKIDKSFIDNLLNNSHDRDIVSLIILLAKRFELKVVAEGIENSDVLKEICDLQVDFSQGFYFSPPLCYNDFMLWCKNFSKA